MGRNTAPASRLLAALTLTPAALVVAVLFAGTALWALWTSFTASKAFPDYQLVGLVQYQRLFRSHRWLQSLENLLIYGLLLLMVALLLGLALALLLNRAGRFSGLFRTVFLYPYALSFIVTGIAWQWLMHPNFGLQSWVRDHGWPNFFFALTSRPDTALLALLIAGVWQCSGLVAVILLSALRGVDQNLIRAAQIEGIPGWRIFLSVILPELKPALLTLTVLLAIGAVKTYDVVIAMTGGGPGLASEMPAKFVVDNLIMRQNLGQATAAASTLLAGVSLILLPLLWLNARRDRR